MVLGNFKRSNRNSTIIWSEMKSITQAIGGVRCSDCDRSRVYCSTFSLYVLPEDWGHAKRTSPMKIPISHENFRNHDTVRNCYFKKVTRIFMQYVGQFYANLHTILCKFAHHLCKLWFYAILFSISGGFLQIHTKSYYFRLRWAFPL